MNIAPYQKPSGMIGFPYQDTVSGTIVGDGTAQTFVFAVNTLLPGLNNRTVVFRRIMVQVLPQNQSYLDDNIVAYYVPISSNGENVATQPFRTMSAVNPTRIGVNVDKLKRIAPGVVFTMSSESTSSVLGIRFGLPPPSGNKFNLRITSVVHMFPQIDAQTVAVVATTAMSPQRADPDDEQNDIVASSVNKKS